MKMVPVRHDLRKQWASGGTYGSFSMTVFIMVSVAILTGCASSMPAKSGSPVKVEPMEIILQSDSASYGLAKLGVLPFSAPQYAPAAEKDVTDFYWQEMVRQGAFRELRMIPHSIKTETEALWWGRQEGCDLVMKPTITYLLDGSGGLPTQLETSIQIIDVRSGRTLWNVRQKAYSEPGADLDLFWTTIPGSPAQRYRFLARALAEQFSLYTISSLSGQSKSPKK